MYINRGARAFMDYANGDTLFIHLGYLTYDPEDMTVAIPKKEVGMEIVEALRGSKTHAKLAAMIKTSDRLMEATLAKDARVTGHGDRHLTQTWVNVPVPTTRVIAE